MESLPAECYLAAGFSVVITSSVTLPLLARPNGIVSLHGLLAAQVTHTHGNNSGGFPVRALPGRLPGGGGGGGGAEDANIDQRH